MILPAILLLLQTVSLEPGDPEVLKAKAELEEGRAAEANRTLENALTRLEATAPKTHELALALYYKGIACASLSDCVEARALFRRALDADPLLTPPSLPRAARDAFESARSDRSKVVQKTRHVGLKEGLIAGGVLGAAGLVFATSGGGSTTSGVVSTLYTGAMLPGAAPLEFPMLIGAEGVVDATVDWIEPGASLNLELDDSTHRALAVSTPTTNTEAHLLVVAAPGSDILVLSRRDTSNQPANYTLTVKHP